MRHLGTALHVVVLVAGTTVATAQEQRPTILVCPGVKSRNTHFSIHNVREAHLTSTGKGVHDYSVIFVEDYQNFEAGKPRPGFRPFLSISSTAPVAAGVVALMRAVNPALTPAQCKELLMTTARPMVYEGAKAPRVVDAAAAVKAAAARR